MHECLTPGTLMKAQWCRSSYHSFHLCHLFSSWTPAILTDLCANRWHLYGKSWDVLLYGMDNALAQTTGGSSSLFFLYFSLSLPISRSLLISVFLINILWPFYKLFRLIKNSYSHFLNIFRITSFYDQQVFQNSTHHFFSFFICLCQSLN